MILSYLSNPSLIEFIKLPPTLFTLTNKAVTHLITTSDYLAYLVNIDMNDSIVTRANNTFNFYTLHKYKLYSTNIKPLTISAPYLENSLPLSLQIIVSTESLEKQL